MKLSAQSVQKILEQEQQEELNLRHGIEEQGIAPGSSMLHKLEGVRKFKADSEDLRSELRAAHQKPRNKHS